MRTFPLLFACGALFACNSEPVQESSDDSVIADSTSVEEALQIGDLTAEEEELVTAVSESGSMSDAKKARDAALVGASEALNVAVSEAYIVRFSKAIGDAENISELEALRSYTPGLAARHELNRAIQTMRTSSTD